MPQRLGTVPHTAARCRTRQQLRKDVLQGIKIKVLHAQPPRPVLCMSTWTQVSPGSSVPHPVHDPASITVLDRPPMCFDICTVNKRVSIRVRGLHLV